MKNKKILLLLMLIGLLLGVVSACSKEVVEEDIPIYSYDTISEEDIVFENENLEFHFSPETTQFYVVVKSTGQIWYSNPQDIDTDTLASSIAKKDLNATISIKYNTESGSATTMNNYASSIEKGNFTYEELDNGVIVNYTIANMEKLFLIPQAVPESRFKQYFDQMDKSSQSMILDNYKIYDINKVRKDENKDDLLAQYPDYATEKIYVLREGNKNDQLKLRMEEYFTAVGYTAEEYELDLARYITESSMDIPVFNVSIQYNLEKDGLLVSLPLDKIQYKKEYPLVEVRPLAYLGAGGLSAEGFLFVPDGSGGIINFNNQKQSQNQYKSNVYGWDYATSRDSVIDETRINMPLFGVSYNNSDTGASLICVLEQGSSYAYIEADVSGRMNNYNFAAANYTLVHSELMNISAKSDKTVRMFQENLPEEVISQRYIFIDDNDYTSMASTYREYLMAKYPELVKKTESDLPVAVELIGAVDRTKHVFGIPTRQPDELTSYKEAKGIVEQLLSYGMTDLSIRYNGWFNDGVIHKAPNKVKLIKELGSKKDFKKLVTYTKDNNVDLYLESTFQFVYNNSISDDFMGIRDSAKFVNRKLCELLPFNPIYYGEADYLYDYNLAKPSYYLKNIDKYADEIADLGVMNIAFGDIGETLSSDYDRKNEVSREKALNLQVEKLSKLNSEGYNIMVNSGNIYAVPYADFIVDVNLASKGYNIIDEEIPFYEIVLHGLVSYSGTPVNIAADYERALLKTAETGAGLYFIFMDADSFELQDSRYTRYFSVDFNEWAEDTKELYQRMKADFGHLYNQYIVGHEKIGDGLYMTEYEDGTQVIVNYNESASFYNGIEVPAKDYIVEGGQQ
ncbi:MAG TPA: DUF5696 domain-containing protein [Mobilitalea sp.]|nr:DUF5696 domain-containing protein [Mobilitalea sp.]